MATGTINGAPIKFLVDTGASNVALAAADAKRMGIDFLNAPRGYSNTANGLASIWIVKLDTVSINGVTLHNIDATIHEQPMPFALLGMSFLNRMDMKREGDIMTLTRRF